jgi:hypothetical protein
MPHLSEPDRGPIASSGGSGVSVFGVARPATEARKAGLPAFDKGWSGCHNRGSNTIWSGQSRRIADASLFDHAGLPQSSGSRVSWASRRGVTFGPAPRTRRAGRHSRETLREGTKSLCRCPLFQYRASRHTSAALPSPRRHLVAAARSIASAIWRVRRS